VFGQDAQDSDGGLVHEDNHNDNQDIDDSKDSGNSGDSAGGHDQGEGVRCPCPCCGYRTFDVEPSPDATCDVCNWAGESNALSLQQARENFAQLGACDEGSVSAVWESPARPERAECLRLLLVAQVPLTARDGNKQTLIHVAARCGNVPALAALLAYSVEHGVVLPPVQARDRWHRTALHWAVLNGHWGALRFLVTRMGAPVNTPAIKALTHRRRTHLVQESAGQICRRLYGDASRPARLLRALEGGQCLSVAAGDTAEVEPSSASTTMAHAGDQQDAVVVGLSADDWWFLTGLAFAFFYVQIGKN
jgi:hypothetical protein